jgi:valyl-tRNA synthetase
MFVGCGGSRNLDNTNLIYCFGGKMSKEINKVYDPKNVEKRLYKEWMDKGYFKGIVDKTKKPFSIVMPPPNITGQLHMGHALDNMMQDAITRFKRMQGFATLWQPGTDHASIATEVKIVDMLAKEGIKKEDLGREKFLEKAWEWRELYGGRIVTQLKELGSSCDWERERFTMDEGCSAAVKETFIRLYEKGLIYQGDRIINWCPNCETALSDAEVEHEDKDSNLWHIHYPASDGGQGIVVATTRPETMLGDVAVAVNPEDERYKDLLGKTVRLPLMDKDIPVIADDYVDLTFGTGAVKITPGHDPNDFDMGARHGLEVIRILTDDGKINQNGGKYEGQDRYEARKNVVKDLTDLGLMDKIDAYSHSVGGCYRCSTVVEPIVSKQWFLSMKELAAPAIKAVEEGKIKFVPERFDKTYFNWMYNIRDWCISRQLWWGHRIPAYYCDCGETIVSRETPEKCPKCAATKFRQEDDVLDTWFSSGLWPFSTLGWPEKTEELEFFYPTNVLVTGYDIIFFWVARMIFFGIEIMGEIPYEFVSIHGIVRDGQGRKMSKSLDNGIDPLEVIDKYGADALRFSLASGNSPGGDMRFYWEKVESCRNFANKIWNASRFVMMNLDEAKADTQLKNLDISDKWILTLLNELIERVTDNYEKYEFGLAASNIYEFLWSEFCDWYIEMAKPRLYGETKADKSLANGVLLKVLTDTLKLLHPLMPFITEEIYTALPGSDETIMTSAWPVVDGNIFEDDKKAMENVMELIRSVRNIRSEMDVVPSKKAKLFLSCDEQSKRSLEKCKAYLLKLAYASEIEFINDKANIPKDAVSVVSDVAECYMPLEDLMDIAKEIARLEKELSDLSTEIKRATGKLNNKGFTDKAPEKVVEAEKAKLEKYKVLFDKVQQRLNSLKDR